MNGIHQIHVCLTLIAPEMIHTKRHKFCLSFCLVIIGNNFSEGRFCFCCPMSFHNLSVSTPDIYMNFTGTLSEEKPFSGIESTICSRSNNKESCSNVICAITCSSSFCTFPSTKITNTFKISCKNYYQCRTIVKITTNCLAQTYLVDLPVGNAIPFSKVVFKLTCRPRCLTKIADFMTISRTSMGRMTTMFSFYLTIYLVIFEKQ